MKKVFTVEEVKKKIERYCMYQDRCHQEVEAKLKEYRLIPEARALILLHLFEYDFLNEERFSKSFARGKFRIKKWGKEKIVRALKLRNITAANIKIALEEIEEEEYINTLNILVEKKNSSINDRDIYKRKKKLFDYLKYRGYETDLVMDAINAIKSS